MTNLPVAAVPYLNSLPFFQGLKLGERFSLVECLPRHTSGKAASGEVIGGLMPLIEYFRNADKFDRVGHFGLASHGRSHSTFLFSRRPVKQLDGAIIGVSPETSTTVCLTRLILEHRYKLVPGRYRRSTSPADPELDALILIGDEALRFRQSNNLFPFEVDVAFEWWLWQHLPCVFAVWAVRKDVAAEDRKRLEAGIAKALAANTGSLEVIAEQAAPRYGMKKEEVHSYLSSFSYRFGKDEEAAIEQVKKLWTEADLLTWDP